MIFEMGWGWEEYKKINNLVKYTIWLNKEIGPIDLIRRIYSYNIGLNLTNVDREISLKSRGQA